MQRRTLLAIIILALVIITPSQNVTHAKKYQPLDLEIIGAQVSIKLGGFHFSILNITNIPFNASNAIIIGTPEYIKCGNQIVYALSIVSFEENNTIRAFTELFTIKYDSSIHNYKAQTVKRLDSLIITDVAPGKNNTLYIAGVDITHPVIIHEEEINVTVESNLLASFKYRKAIGARSIILRLDCDMNIVASTSYLGFSIESIDYNPVYGVLAAEGYLVTTNQGEDSSTTIRVNKQRILLLDAYNLGQLYETRTRDVDTLFTPPTGIKWSPTGKYLAAGYLVEGHPALYEYLPRDHSIRLVSVENVSISPPLLTLGWVGTNDTLLLGNRSTLIIYMPETNIREELLELTLISRLIICCGHQPIKDLQLVASYDNYAEYVLLANFTWSIVKRTSITGIYYDTYNDTIIVMPATGEISTVSTLSLDLNLLPFTDPSYEYSQYWEYTLVYPRPYTLKYLQTENMLELYIYYDVIAVVNNSPIIIHTEPGALINISSAQIHLRDTLQVETSTLIYYTDPSTYTLIVQLPVPENYIGPRGMLTQARQVTLAKNQSLDIYLDYDHLLGRLIIYSPITGNLTIEVFQLQRKQGTEINQSTQYYLAPGKYIVEIKSNNPLYLVNSSYTINLDPGELYTVNLSLARLEISTTRHHRIEITGPGGSTVIQGVEGRKTLWLTPGEYKVKLLDLESGEEKILTIQVMKGQIVSLDAQVYNYTPQESGTTEEREQGRFPSTIFLTIILVILIIIIVFVKTTSSRKV